MSIIYTILVFILTISIIVTFHEYGHYLAARLCGVKVLEFSVGFGKKLIGKKFGKDQTDYKVCALPLGGYVKMLDEREGVVNDDEKDRAFNNQNLFKRFIIVFSGPLFNFILAIFFYFLIFFSGYNGIQPLVGFVLNNSIAETIDLQQNDIIYSVNLVKVKTWSDVTLQTVKFLSEKKNIKFEVLRNNKNLFLKEIQYKDVSFNEPNILKYLGILNFTNKSSTIGYVEDNSPAYFSGLINGDKIISINSMKIKNWNDIVRNIESNPDVNLNFHILRDGNTLYLKVKPDSILKDNINIGRLGVAPLIDQDLINLNTITITHSFFDSLKLAALKTYDFTVLTINFIAKLIQGEASASGISGPVGIANYAADSFSNGYSSFLGLLAMLSISIGILNLLPIPILDGGHLMFYLVEFIIGKPIPDNIQYVFAQVGMTLLLLLSVFALYNDLVRIM